jgi:hypothetical protein
LFQAETMLQEVMAQLKSNTEQVNILTNQLRERETQSTRFFAISPLYNSSYIVQVIKEVKNELEVETQGTKKELQQLINEKIQLQNQIAQVIFFFSMDSHFN